MSWSREIDCTHLSEHQAKHATHAFGRGSLGILGGSPGTGKTFTAAQVIRGMGQEIGYQHIACAAPTGKAAVRLTEAMQQYNIPLAATTIHSLLKVQSSDGGWSFAFNRANPLPHKAIIIDEASMIDTDLFCSLLAARARNTVVLVIGDVQQLPPVGHGAPLRDMIRSGCVPYGELREIRRNSGGIVQACADIRDGKPFQCAGNLELAACGTARQQKDAMLETIDQKAKLFGVDPVWGVQVLCAVNKKSELSRRELNKLLQHTLNPNPAIAGSPFRMRDKVICLKNSWLPLVEVERAGGRMKVIDNDPGAQTNEKGQVYVANGEMGQVVRVEPKYFHVQLTTPKRLVVVPRGKAEEAPEDPAGDEDGNVEETSSTGCDWDLAYAISTHKSQGSEFSVAIVMIDESAGARRVCCKEWLYTSISRAKQCCVLVGKLSVAQSFCKRTAIDKRKTFLAQRIQEGTRTL
jgi:exodeoxyribonuclease V alpha subunit